MAKHMKTKAKTKSSHKKTIKKSVVKKDDETFIDFSMLWKNFKTYFPYLLIIIPIILTIQFRTLPAELEAAEDWAKNNIHNSIRQQIDSQISQQYPTMPADKRKTFVNEKFSESLAAQQTEIDKAIKDLVKQYKDLYRDDEGTTYLSDIDSYMWLRQARNIVEKGRVGDKVSETGKQIDDHMMAPLGTSAAPSLHPYFEAYLYKVVKIFKDDFTLMRSAYLTPLIIAVLSSILAFLVARHFGGPISGTVAAIILAVNPMFLSRTIGSDNDIWNTFFPLLILWLFIEAFECKNNKWKFTLASLSGFSCGFYTFAWNAGWWFTFDNLMASMVIFFVILILAYARELKDGIPNFIKKHDLKPVLYSLGLFIVSTAIVVTIFTSLKNFFNAPLIPLDLLSIKEASHGTLWPNVYTTVAELNSAPLSSIVSNVGGWGFFFISLFGATMAMFRKKKAYFFAAFTIVWFWLMKLLFKSSIDSSSLFFFTFMISIPMIVGLFISVFKQKTFNIDSKYTIYFIFWMAVCFFITGKGVRFIFLYLPIFAITFGMAFGLFYQKVIQLLEDIILKFKDVLPKSMVSYKTYLMVFVQLLLLVWFASALSEPIENSHKMSRSLFPTVNDGWYDALTHIKDNSEPDAIINSWWDFGHWFKYFADRPVTFDGASQNSPMAHWIGKVLLTDNETQAMGILRMLDCGSNEAFEYLNDRKNDTLESINTLYSIFGTDIDYARSYMNSGSGLSSAETEEFLKLTHCDPPENFFIASGDMIGKAGVWAHFGSWDFEKAYIWNSVRKEEKDQALETIKEIYPDYTDVQTVNLYNKLKNYEERQGNDWISPWPSFLSGIGGCNMQNSDIICSNNLQGTKIKATINGFTGNTTLEFNGQKAVPRSMVSVTPEGIMSVSYPDSQFPYAIVVYPAMNGRFSNVLMSDELAKSMFVRMYLMRGHGLEYFKPSTVTMETSGSEIHVYKVDWDGGEKNMAFTLQQQEPVKVAETSASTLVEVDREEIVE